MSEAAADGAGGFIKGAISRRKDSDGSEELATTPTTEPSRRSNSTGVASSARHGKTGLQRGQTFLIMCVTDLSTD